MGGILTDGKHSQSLPLTKTFSLPRDVICSAFNPAMGRRLSLFSSRCLPFPRLLLASDKRPVYSRLQCFHAFSPYVLGDRQGGALFLLYGLSFSYLGIYWEPHSGSRAECLKVRALSTTFLTNSSFFPLPLHSRCTCLMTMESHSRKFQQS